MPIKKDGTGKRWVEMEFVAKATPEQIWNAMATGAGNSSWFTKATIEERVGGELTFTFGTAGSSKGEVTEWQPPQRFGYVERDWSPGAPPVATEITITARSGDTCVVRMVHSLFATSDDWDDQMESFESGWPSFFEVLRLYLAHFPNQRGASFQVMHLVAGEDLDVWKRLLAALGLDNPNVGERRSTTQPEELSGVVERTHQDGKHRYVVVRVDSPLPGIALIGTDAMGGRVNAGVMGYCYGEAAEARGEAGAAKWRAWMSDALGAT